MDTGRELESVALDAFVIVMFNKWTCDHFDRVWPDEGRDSFRVVTRKERLEL